MAKKPEKRDKVKEIVLTYLKMLHKTDLSTEDRDRTRTKDKLISAIYELYPDRIFETGVGVKREGAVEVCRSSVEKAITELEKVDKRIEKKYGFYRYIPLPDELFQEYPVLKIASEITIEPLNVASFLFYRTSAQYALWITNYINAQFSRDDIYAVNLGDIIMVLDLHIPIGSSSVVKRHTLQERIDHVLRFYKIKEPDAFDEKNGISAKEYRRMQEEAEAERFYAWAKEYEKEQERERMCGSIETNQLVRNFKRKNTNE